MKHAASIKHNYTLIEAEQYDRHAPHLGTEPDEVDSPDEFAVAGGVGQLRAQDVVAGRHQAEGVPRDPLLRCGLERAPA